MNCKRNYRNSRTPDNTLLNDEQVNEEPRSCFDTGGRGDAFDAFVATTINYGHSANYLLVLMKIKGVHVPDPVTPSHTLLYRAGE